MTTVDKRSPAGRAAVAEMNEVLNFDMESVLTPDSWIVAIVDGKAEVAINRDGVRALGLFSPLPNGPELAERIIAHLEARQQRGDR